MRIKLFFLLLFLSFIGACKPEFCPEGSILKEKDRVAGGAKWCVLEKIDGPEVKEGPYIEWHSPTQKKAEGAYQKDKRHGKWTFWHKNGKKSREQTFSKGKRNGPFVTWDKKGKKKKKGVFKNGKRHGTFIGWYPNGNKRDEVVWENGRTRGEWSYWYENGNLRKSGKRKDGKYTGQWVFKQKDGKFSARTHFDDGKKSGLSETFHPNGKLSAKGQYKNDTKTGTWTFFNKYGKKIRTETYDFPKDLKNKQKSAPIDSTPPPKGQNVLLLVVDALRADGLTPYGYDKPTSPATGRIASEGILFENAHAASPWTAPSFATIMSGVSPTVHRVGWRLYREKEIEKNETMNVGSIHITRLSQGIPTIGELMKKKKLLTGAILNNAFLHPDTGLSRQFDYYDLIIPHEKKMKQYRAKKGSSRLADEVTQTAVSWLTKNREKKFFLLLHYFDPHSAYAPPQKYREQFATFDTKRYKRGFSDVIALRTNKTKINDKEKEQIRGLYDGEVRFTEDQIDILLTEMDKMGLLDNTWIIFTADHGEEMFDHGFVDHGHRYEEEVTRIPLIIRAPGGKWNAGVRIPTSVRHLDLLPTILDIKGIKAPEILEGESLLPLISESGGKDRPAYMEYNLYWGQQYAWYDGRYKLVLPVDPKKGKGFMYDLKTDPKEKKPLDETHPMFNKLKKQVEAHRAYLSGHAQTYTKASKTVKLSKEVEESLKALGYVE